MTARLTAGAILAAALTLTSCGGKDGDDPCSCYVGTKVRISGPRDSTITSCSVLVRGTNLKYCNCGTDDNLRYDDQPTCSGAPQ